MSRVWRDEDDYNLTIDWRRVPWAVLFWAIGFGILATIPPTNSGVFVLAGAVAASVGAWFAAKAIL